MKDSIQEILQDTINKLVISNPKQKSQEIKKISIRMVKIKDSLVFQCEEYTVTQVFHKNVLQQDIENQIIDYMKEFKQLDAYTLNYEYHIKISKKDKAFVSKIPLKQKVEISYDHNRQKSYLLKEGEHIPALKELGVFTKEGKIVRSMYDKYKQINRYIEMIDDIIKEDNIKFLRIIDFGCGKSYLTFIVYYYLTEIKKIDVDIIGLDLKQDVIEHCNQLAKDYNYNNLRFEVGNINGYHSSEKIDMVISLHACDTATDYALFNAIQWNATYILSVPCCQHELNQSLSMEEYQLITRYGLIQERISSLVTDAIRANLLQSQGYETQILEFIDMQHSLKNICIRAKKKNCNKQKELLEEVVKIQELMHSELTLYRLLKQAKKV